MARERFLDQARLLVRLLPIVGEENVFALKGGTAINLFYRDMPRLSVDIDLTYLPLQSREASIVDLAPAYENEFRGMTVDPIALRDLQETRDRLVHDIRSRLDASARAFLLSLLDGVPDFSSIQRSEASELPAIGWKVRNLERLRGEDPAKHALQRRNLEELL